MANYPTTFSSELIPLSEVPLGDRGQMGLERLHDAGFEAFAGMRTVDVPPLFEIASSDAVREYCPNDVLARIRTVRVTGEWLEGGKGAILLKRIADEAMAGYGWTSNAGSEERALIPGEVATFAERLGEIAAGRGLGAAFADVIVDGNVALYGVRNIGFQTYGSNTGAVRSYLKAGGELVTTKDCYRPTLRPTAAERTDTVHPGERRDVRLFMKYARTFLPQVA